MVVKKTTFQGFQSCPKEKFPSTIVFLQTRGKVSGVADFIEFKFISFKKECTEVALQSKLIFKGPPIISFKLLVLSREDPNTE